jgi:hypothetical protein
MFAVRITDKDVFIKKANDNNLDVAVSRFYRVKNTIQNGTLVIGRAVILSFHLEFDDQQTGDVVQWTYEEELAIKHNHIPCETFLVNDLEKVFNNFTMHHGVTSV